MSRIISYSKNCLYSPVISRKWTHKIPKTVVFVHLSSFGISVVKVFLQYINCCGPTFRANKEFTQLKMFTKNNFFDSWPQRYSRKAAKDLDRETDTRLSLNLSVCVTTLTVGRIGKNVCLTCHRGMLGTRAGGNHL